MFTDIMFAFLIFASYDDEEKKNVDL